MNKRKKILLTVSGIVILLLAGTILFVVLHLDRGAKRSEEQISRSSIYALSLIENKICDGDIILRAGSGVWSECAVDCSRRDKRFSHAGILFFENDRWMVIHSEANGLIANQAGVFIEPAVSFFNINKKFAVYRLKEREKAANLAAYAKKYLNIPFDFSFVMEDQSKIYCTELIYLAMQESGITLETYIHPALKKRIIPVDSCNDPEIFDEIVLVDKNKFPATSEK